MLRLKDHWETIFIFSGNHSLTQDFGSREEMGKRKKEKDSKRTDAVRLGSRIPDSKYTLGSHYLCLTNTAINLKQESQT